MAIPLQRLKDLSKDTMGNGAISKPGSNNRVRLPSVSNKVILEHDW